MPWWAKVGLNAALGGGTALLNDCTHGECDEHHLTRDVLVGVGTGAIEGFGGGPWTTVGLDVLGGGADNALSQGLDNGWGNIDPRQAVFGAAISGEVGAFSYLGQFGAPQIQKLLPQKLSEDISKEIGYNALYTVTDVGVGACNTYSAIVKQGNC